MSPLIEDEKKLESQLTQDRIVAPAFGSILLHVLLIGGVVAWGVVVGLFHRDRWGSEQAGGSIQAQITNTLPLPNDQPPNQNVLSTETPSPAPAEPQPKPQKAVEENAVPIASKVKQKPQKPDKKTAPQTPQHQPVPQPANRAHYGEQGGSSMPRAMQQNVGNGPVAVNSGDFGSRFGYYVTNIERKMSANWYRQLVDSRTSKGTRAFILFTIHRDGSVSDVRLDRSSGVPTLDRSCLQAAQRVESFGSLPTQYNQSTLITSYYCEY